MENNNRIDEFIADPKRALFVLAGPVLVSMAVQTAYSLADAAFVGRLGTEAIAALSFASPMFFILIAINSGISTGMSSMVARYLGARDVEKAENAAIHSTMISVFTALVIFAGSFFILRPMLELFGATGHVLDLAVGFLQIIFAGTLFMFPAFTIDSIFSSEGNTLLSMRIQIFSLLANIILDPILIYGFHLGVQGAALATFIATFLALIISIYYLKKRSYIKLDPKYFHFSWDIIKENFFIGVPSAFMVMLISMYVVFLNKFMAHFGTEYVAAFGLVSRLESVSILLPFGFSIALLTLTGMFFGAKRFDLLKKISWYAIEISSAFSILIGIIFFFWPEFFLRAFTSDATLLELGGKYLRLDVITFPLMAIMLTSTRALQGIGTGVPGFVANLVKIFFVAVPLSYLFVYVLGYGYLSIAVAMILGGLVASLVSLIWLRIKLEKEAGRSQE
jgi:putative MATE family efflux protein